LTRPRVLHVIEAFRGGTSRHLSDLVTFATGADHVVALPFDSPGSASQAGAGFDQDALDAIEAAGAGIHRLAMKRRPWDPSNARAAAALYRLARRVDPAVVHGHSAVGGALTRMVGPALGTVAIAYTPHGVAVGRTYRATERALGRVTDRWIAVSPSEAELARSGRLCRPERIEVIPNGVDLAAPPGPAPVALRQVLGLAPGTPLVGTVARLVAQKAPVRFVEVCAGVAGRHPAAHFVLIGDGPLRAPVERAVGAASLGSRFHHLPALPRARDVVGQFDVCVLASAFEGAPYTPLDAMRAGVPVVLSDVVGNRDVAEDGRSGVLRPPGDTAGMAAAAARLLVDRSWRDSIVAAARARLAERFDVRDTGARHCRLYEELAGRRSTRRLPQPRARSSAHPDSRAAQ
jgi:glycosyltransferase involved in cell wall biosynthesis